MWLTLNTTKRQCLWFLLAGLSAGQTANIAVTDVLIYRFVALDAILQFWESLTLTLTCDCLTFSPQRAIGMFRTWCKCGGERPVRLSGNGQTQTTTLHFLLLRSVHVCVWSVNFVWLWDFCRLFEHNDSMFHGWNLAWQSKPQFCCKCVIRCIGNM